VVRRRRAALLSVALCALAAGVAVGARGGDPACALTPRDPTAGLTLRQLAGQVVVMRVRGPSLPPYAARALARDAAAGVILFDDNLLAPAQGRRLTGQIQRAARGGALVATDQEGGSIRNVPWAGPGGAAWGIGTPAEARAAGRVAALAVRAVGINVNLAPVADQAAVAGSIMRSRAFPGSPEAVARMVRANLAGYAGTGVAPTAKHFPGLGASTVNTDEAPATLSSYELAPFRAAIDAGVPIVMTSHALYPSLDPDRIASQSEPIIAGLLRRRLGFRGAVMTDSLEARAVLARSSVATAAVRSLLAGSDLLLTTGAGSYPEVYAAVLEAARRSPAARERLREAARRVLALKAQLGVALPRGAVAAPSARAEPVRERRAPASAAGANC
jgi:beta-N-acetylhexosaminidase